MQEIFIVGNPWYYTLSTIAQVFASIVGLYSVFVIFKIEKINEWIEEIRSISIDFIASVENHERVNSKPPKKMIIAVELTRLTDQQILNRVKRNLQVAEKIGMSASYGIARMHLTQASIPLTLKREITRKQKVINSSNNYFFRDFRFNTISMSQLAGNNYEYIFFDCFNYFSYKKHFRNHQRISMMTVYRKNSDFIRDQSGSFL